MQGQGTESLVGGSEGETLQHSIVSVVISHKIMTKNITSIYSFKNTDYSQPPLANPQIMCYNSYCIYKNALTKRVNVYHRPQRAVIAEKRRQETHRSSLPSGAAESACASLGRDGLCRYTLNECPIFGNQGGITENYSPLRIVAGVFIFLLNNIIGGYLWTNEF